MKYLITLPEKDSGQILWVLEKLLGKNNIMPVAQPETTRNTPTGHKTADTTAALQEDFTWEDLLDPARRTEVHRILGRIIIEHGQSMDGMKVYPLRKGLKNQKDIWLAMKTSESKHLPHLPGEVFLLYRGFDSMLNRQYDYNSLLLQKYNEEELKLTETLIKVQTAQDPTLMEPKQYDPADDLGIRLISIYEMRRKKLISGRLLNSLRAADLMTAGLIANTPRSVISQMRNLGKKSITELEIALESCGIPWDTPDER